MVLQYIQQVCMRGIDRTVSGGLRIQPTEEEDVL